MSVRPTKNRKIFTLYEDSFHDFKGRYFNIFVVGNHCPFWLSLEGDSLFPPYWSDQAGFDIASVKYEGLNADKRDTADILTFLFSKNNLSSKSLLGSPEESRKAIVKMAGNDVTLSRLRRLIRPTLTRSLPSSSAPVASATSAGKALVEPDGDSSTNVGDASERLVKVSSPVRDEIPLSPLPSPKKRRSAMEGLSEPKRPQTLEGVRGNFVPWIAPLMFQASLGARCWVPELRRSFGISVEPRLTIAEEAERRNAKLLGDAKTLNLQKMVLEEEKADAIWAKLKAEEDLKALKAELETLEREKGAEIDCLRRQEEGFLAKVKKFLGLVAEEKVRADLAKVSMSELQKQCEDLAEDAKGAIAATEGALKAQLAILVPDFNTDQISFFKDIMDNKIVDSSD
ncbi:hypothetical protein PIB30_099812 [Stylosanthes scabra]|uniref:Uncharacterized protein n=1 Tax=Stylosanthes scabra TaxID=79078 RepID=A0ABU6VY66_9FABA|nr:hypothetical protein [Stylosanthes scabra]